MKPSIHAVFYIVVTVLLLCDYVAYSFSFKIYKKSPARQFVIVDRVQRPISTRLAAMVNCEVNDFDNQVTKHAGPVIVNFHGEKFNPCKVFKW